MTRKKDAAAAKKPWRAPAEKAEAAAKPVQRTSGNAPGAGQSSYGAQAAELRAKTEETVHEGWAKAVRGVVDEDGGEESGGKPAKAKAPAEMYRFVLLGGEYNDRATGKVYRYDKNKETVITSPHRLDEIFMNKYRRLDGPTSPGRDFQDVFDRPGLVDPPAAEQFPHGRPSDFDGDIGPAAMTKLIQDRESTMIEGTDVTAQFPSAKGADLKVFKQGGNYFVADASDPDHALNHDKDLTTKGQVEKFIEEEGSE